MEIVLEAGGDDIVTEEQGFTVYTAPADFEEVRNAVVGAGIVTEVAAAEIGTGIGTGIEDRIAGRQPSFHLRDLRRTDAKILRDGLGQPRALPTARHWFETAASQKYQPAYLPTGELYFNGPADPNTGGLSANDLAKTYLWLSAASRTVATSAPVAITTALDTT